MNGLQFLSAGAVLATAMLAACVADGSGLGPIDLVRDGTTRIEGTVVSVGVRDGESVARVAVESVSHLAPDRGDPVPVVDGIAELVVADSDLEEGEAYSVWVGWREAGVPAPVVVFGVDDDQEILASYSGRSDNRSDVPDVIACLQTSLRLTDTVSVLDQLAREGRDSPEEPGAVALNRCAIE